MRLHVDAQNPGMHGRNGMDAMSLPVSKRRRLGITPRMLRRRA
jgi:hypothetical protein